MRRDYRVRLFNRKWIEGMMKEGYAGADQIAVHVSNTMGWKIMREGSVSDDDLNEIAAIYVKDKLGLSLRQWFEAQNPFAFQDMSEVLLESSRKGFWKADPGLLREVAEQYARSVVRHGEGGGLRGGGNARWSSSSPRLCNRPIPAEMDQLAARYQDRLRQRQPRRRLPTRRPDPRSSRLRRSGESATGSSTNGRRHSRRGRWSTSGEPDCLRPGAADGKVHARRLEPRRPLNR